MKKVSKSRNAKKSKKLTQKELKKISGGIFATFGRGNGSNYSSDGSTSGSGG
jgi:bacteriocin-like protein